MKPIQSVSAAMRSLSGSEINRIPNRDELAEMQMSLQHFRDKLKEAEVLREEAQKAEEQRREDARSLRLKFLSELEQSVGELIISIVKLSADLEQTARELEVEVTSAGTQAERVYESSEITTRRTQAIAEAAVEMSQSISTILEQTSRSKQVGDTAVQETHDLTFTVTQLSQATEDVLEILNIVSEIADQTDLLSVNAAIQASRAGEAGMGFSIVAAEVKDLALRVAESTSTINKKVDGIRNSVTLATKSIKSVASQVSTMSVYSSEISRAVDTQKKTTDEISLNINDAAENTVRVRLCAEQVRLSVSSVNDGARRVGARAKSMSEQAEQLRQDTREFVLKMRAA